VTALRVIIYKYTAVRLPEQMLDRIDAIAGTGKRSEFIRQSIENELARREQDDASTVHSRQVHAFGSTTDTPITRYLDAAPAKVTVKMVEPKKQRSSPRAKKASK